MVIETKRVFMEGNFVDRNELDARQAGVSKIPVNWIEILREFSSTELIGKVYVRTIGGNVEAQTPMGVRSFGWYQRYEQLQRGSTSDRNFYFETQTGDLWLVTFVRFESDETGGYVAVGLQREGFRTRVA